MKPSLYLFPFIALLSLSACAPEAPPPKPRPVPGRSAPMVQTPSPAPSIGAIPATAVPVKVALLVPLSGESAAVGNAMLDAATLAVTDSYLTMPTAQIRSQIILLPKDTGTSPATATKAAQQALDQGASFIIGPLFSQSVTAIAPMAQEKHVGILSFSNNQAAASTNVFVYGFLPEQQVVRIAEFAYQHNLTRVALLAPNDAYGLKVQQLLNDAYRKKGGSVAPAELYAPSSANIEAAVGRLAAGYANMPADKRFQALFIADGGPQLKTIIAALKKSGLDMSKIKLLGTGLWDDPEIVKIPDMAGAWFPSSPPAPYQQFEKHFVATYGYSPVRLASLAYDAVNLAASLTVSAGPNGLSSGALTDPHGFVGPANGLYRLRADGTSERRLAIMEVTRSGFKVIDLAPGGF